MATLLEDWRNKAYGDGLTKAEQQKLWNEYFALEKGFYEEVLFHFTGVLDGIDDSLKGYHNPIDTMDENTTVKIEIDPEKLYYNMVEAKASWLYGLPQWDSILTQERRKELYKEQKNSGTIRRQGKKIYPNDPCPCGSGKKYKKCHMRIDEENELKMYREEQNA